MNRTQKTAWALLTQTLVFLGFFIFLFYEIAVLKKLFLSIHWVWALIFFVLVAGGFVFMFKKQSPKEVPSDERDKSIQARAMMAAFISCWVLLPAGCLVLRFVLGTGGSIETWLLTLVIFFILLITMLVYSVAILIQYGWREKGEQS